MAGDSETRLHDQEENGNAKPFLIGVSGGTASGKVCILPFFFKSSPFLFMNMSFVYMAIYNEECARAAAEWLLFQLRYKSNQSLNITHTFTILSRQVNTFNVALKEVYQFVGMEVVFSLSTRHQYATALIQR